MTELPIGILNKKETGCGATHLALTNNQNIIVVVPTVELIKNKTSQLEGLFGVYAGINMLDLQNYIYNIGNKPIKIMVTYDSLSKLTK
jgi:hypothetical protein